MARETNILDHLAVVARWRRMIFLSVFTVCLLTAVVSLLLPKAYSARAVVYPPKEGQDAFGLSALLSNLPLGILGMGESSVSATDFVPVLRSERVAEAVAKRFDFVTRYGLESREDMLALVDDRLDVELTRERFLMVSFEAETPELAADMTNAFVEELDRALQSRRREQAAGLRDYFAQRLAETEDAMRKAEAAFSAFQQKHMAIDLEAQAKAQIEGASSLIIGTLGEMIIKREIAARMMEKGNPQLKQMDEEIAAARDALDGMLMGKASSAAQQRSNGKLPDVVIPFEDYPGLGLKALQFKRDVEIQNAIYQFVLQEYEKYRFEEGKETAVVVVLDKAQPPTVRSRPRRKLMVFTAGGLSLLISVILAFVLETVRGLAPEDRQKLDAIRAELRRKGDA
jgi:uncharacterized protein involved in exopolysaccharide biosynthesis